MIDTRVLKNLEELSRLELTPCEEEKFGEDIEKIIYYMDKLKEIPSEGEELSHIFMGTSNLRKDEIYPSLNREDMLKNAVEKEDGYFKVPCSIKE